MEIEPPNVCINPGVSLHKVKDKYQGEIFCAIPNTQKTQPVSLPDDGRPIESIIERALNRCSLSCDVCKNRKPSKLP